jgi:hypothetical protein
LSEGADGEADDRGERDGGTEPHGAPPVVGPDARLREVKSAGQWRNSKNVRAYRFVDGESPTSTSR